MGRLAQHGASLRADLKIEPLPGPDERPERRALAEARRMAALPSRKPTEADRPPPSTFPMTSAARATPRAFAKEALGLTPTPNLPRDSGKVAAVNGLTTVGQAVESD